MQVTTPSQSGRGQLWPQLRTPSHIPFSSGCTQRDCQLAASPAASVVPLSVPSLCLSPPPQLDHPPSSLLPVSYCKSPHWLLASRSARGELCRAQWPRAQPLEWDQGQSGGHVDTQLWSAPQCPSLGDHQAHPASLVPPRTPKQETTSTPSPLPFPSSSQHRVLYCPSSHVSPFPRTPSLVQTRSHHTFVLVINRVRLFVTFWTVAHEAPLPMGFSRQEYWSGLSRLLKHHPCQPAPLHLVTGKCSTHWGWNISLPGREPSFIYLSAYFPVILQRSSSILCMAVPYGCPFLPLAKLCFWNWHLSPHPEGGRRTPSFITILF